jgi:hypothetical protein
MVRCILSKTADVTFEEEQIGCTVGLGLVYVSIAVHVLPYLIVQHVSRHETTSEMTRAR